jgi:hypothetical protein
MQGFLSDDVKITRVIGPTVTGTTTIAGTTLDMAGYDGVLFIGSIVTAAAGNKLKVSEGDASNGSDKTDLASSGNASDGTSTQFVNDVLRPAKRYITPQVVRGTTTVIDSVWAIQYKARSQPVVNALANTLTLVKQLTPSEGTA